MQTMTSILLSKHFYKQEALAVLNTLFPPAIQELPNSKINPKVLYQQRAIFYRYILDVASNGPGIMVEFEKKLKEKKLNGEAGQESEGNPLSPTNLAMINQKLQGMQVDDMVHQQTCLQIGTSGGGRVMFHENFISMNELKKKVAPDVNLFASPWLFQYLTETLDRRILGIMAERDFDLLKEPISVNLNISTVLSRQFRNFHKSVGDNTQKVIIELQIIDIFADINSYGYARDSLQEMGYQVLADGLSPISLQFFDPAQLRSDFIKISWGSEFESDDNNR